MDFETVKEIIAQDVENQYSEAQFIKVYTYGNDDLEILEIEILNVDNEKIAYYSNSNWGWANEIVCQCEDIINKIGRGFLLNLETLEIQES